MSTLADLQAPVSSEHYSSFDENKFVVTVPLMTVLPVVRRAIMLGLVKSLTIDPILIFLI